MNYSKFVCNVVMGNVISLSILEKEKVRFFYKGTDR